MYKVVLNDHGKYTSLCGEVEYTRRYFTAPEFGKLFVFRDFTPAEGFLRKIREDYPNAELWEVEVTGTVEPLNWEPCTITRDFWFPLECWKSLEFRPCPRGTMIVSSVKLIRMVSTLEDLEIGDES